MHDRLSAVRWDEGPGRDSIAPTAVLRPRALAKGTRKQPAQPDANEQFGPYVVHERLGSGGMASVHRAEAHGIGGFCKSIALKRMWPHLAADREFVESFIQEARLASQLRHDNIAQAYDLGKIDDTYYIAMEFVPGPTLTQVMKQANTAAGAIPLPILVEILIQLCDALDYAHNLRDSEGRPLGIIHRDVSPANIIVSSSGIVKLIDFGIAKAERSNIHTQTGIIKGKLAYVAPEYTLGHLDLRADLFGLGVIAYELLTGQRLFLGDSEYDTLKNVREKPIQPPSRRNPAISRDLDDIVLTALQRDPAKRWQNAAAMRIALGNVAREFSAAVSGQQIRDWTLWAFQQPPRSETQIGRLLEALEPSVSIDQHFAYESSTVSVPHAEEFQATALQRMPSESRSPVSYYEPARPPRRSKHRDVHFANTQLIMRMQERRSSGPWLMLVLLLVLAGAAWSQDWVDLEKAREIGAVLAEPAPAYAQADR